MVADIQRNDQQGIGREISGDLFGRRLKTRTPGRLPQNDEDRTNLLAVLYEELLPGRSGLDPKDSSQGFHELPESPGIHLSPLRLPNEQDLET